LGKIPKYLETSGKQFIGIYLLIEVMIIPKGGRGVACTPGVFLSCFWSDINKAAGVLLV